MLKKVTTAAAVLSLVASPALAEASVSRSSAPVEAKSELGGSGLIIGLLALGAVIAGVIAATGGDDAPVSA